LLADSTKIALASRKVYSLCCGETGCKACRNSKIEFKVRDVGLVRCRHIRLLEHSVIFGRAIARVWSKGACTSRWFGVFKVWSSYVWQFVHFVTEFVFVVIDANWWRGKFGGFVCTVVPLSELYFLPTMLPAEGRFCLC